MAAVFPLAPPPLIAIHPNITEEGVSSCTPPQARGSAMLSRRSDKSSSLALLTKALMVPPMLSATHLLSKYWGNNDNRYSILYSGSVISSPLNSPMTEPYENMIPPPMSSSRTFFHNNFSIDMASNPSTLESIFNDLMNGAEIFCVKISLRFLITLSSASTVCCPTQLASSNGSNFPRSSTATLRISKRDTITSASCILTKEASRDLNNISNRFCAAS
mmetsp:Transcript_18645/g.47010  ORF Transcript_18645/g.47010 Transcript_18645/m.47010 type:complete len:218 (+) Transcript_18645:2137-2790(+)